MTDAVQILLGKFANPSAPAKLSLHTIEYLQEKKQIHSLVIGGHQRSGTTLLTELCNSHPDVGVTFEYRIYRHIGKTSAQFRRRLRRNSLGRPIVVGSGQYKRLINGHIFDWQFKRKVAAHTKRRDKIDVPTVTSALSQTFEKPVVGDKWPGYVFELEHLVNLDIRRIMIYRDCRDVAVSALKMAKTNWRETSLGQQTNSVDKVARRWVQTMQALETYADHVHLIRYEELVQNPEPTLAALADYLGVDPQGFQAEHIHAASVANYRSSLSDKQLEQIEDIAGQWLDQYGYD